MAGLIAMVSLEFVGLTSPGLAVPSGAISAARGRLSNELAFPLHLVIQSINPSLPLSRLRVVHQGGGGSGIPVGWIQREPCHRASLWPCGFARGVRAIGYIHAPTLR